MSTDLQTVLAKATEVVKEAGAFQMKHFRSMPASAHDNKDIREMVSFVDVESEKILQDGLMPLVPEAGFYGEDSGKTGSQTYCWVVDPLDGTTNYLSGMDQFVVSAALVEDGVTKLGIILKPANGELFYAVEGGGLFHNGKKLPNVSKTLTSKDALYVTGFPYRSPDVFDAFFKCAGEVLLEGRGLRRFGSAAMDLCMVAAGWMQGFWESDLQPYDIACGMLFLQETGCIVTNEKGGVYDIFKDRMMVAALPEVYKTLLEIVHRNYGDLS